MVVKAGMTPEQALKTATVNGRIARYERRPRQGDPGHFADLVAVEGDPLVNVQVVIEKIKGVMKGGVVVVKR